MCVEDYRIARFVKTHATTFALGIGGTKSFGSGQQRVGLMITNIYNDTDTIDTTKVVFDHGAVIMLSFQVPTLMLPITTYGSLVQQSFVVSAPVEAHSVCITEFYLPESFLAINNEWLRTKYGIELGI